MSGSVSGPRPVALTGTYSTWEAKLSAAETISGETFQSRSRTSLETSSIPSMFTAE